MYYRRTNNTRVRKTLRRTTIGTATQGHSEVLVLAVAETRGSKGWEGTKKERGTQAGREREKARVIEKSMRRDERVGLREKDLSKQIHLAR